MADAWVCSICFVFTALTLRSLVKHITVAHASQPNFKVKCVIPGCPTEYKKINSLRTHLRRRHKQCLDPTVEGEHTEQTQDDQQQSELNTQHSSSSLSNSENESDDSYLGDTNLTKEPIDLKRCASHFVVKLQARSKLSKVAINNIVGNTSVLIDQVKENLKEKVMSRIEGMADSATTEAVGQIFDTIDDPFAEFGTTYRQKSYVEKNMNFVAPCQYVLGKKIGYRNKGPKRVVCEQEDTMVYIPILESLKQLLSNTKIFEMMVENPRQCKEGILYDICDGHYCKTNKIFQDHPDALLIILYHDEVEVCNPLGSHASKHKVDLYYYTLGNINPKYRSKLCAIKLLAIVKAQDVLTYGPNQILAPIFNDLAKLADGHIFDINGQERELFGTVVCCLGDTEGQHQWGGFKIKVGWAHQKCRCCLCTFIEMQVNFRSCLFPERSRQQYNEHCNQIESAPTPQARKNLETTYGIVNRSLLSKLPGFDITKQLPQDTMHVLLEGSVQYELRHVLQYFIENGFFTLQQLNRTFTSLSIQYQDEANRPPFLKNSLFNGQEKYKLKQTAEQARIFLKYLPFCISRFVGHGNRHYQLIMQMVSIVLTCFSPVISETTTRQLEDTIETHLKQFKELFPTVNITPKMHYMIHLPKQTLHLGPLIRQSCMRFEARHQYFKDLATRQNFKNICLSLAEQCQYDDCADFMNEDPSNHPLFAGEKELGPTKEVDAEAKRHFLHHVVGAELFANPKMLTRISKAKWIRIHGTKYVAYKMCVVAVNATFVPRAPVFGKLKSIWLANEHVLFEYEPYRTITFDETLMAYQVEELSDGICEFCHINTMLDYNVYSFQKLNNGLYVPLKYYLGDVIDQHVIGENPLHF